MGHGCHACGCPNGCECKEIEDQRQSQEILKKLTTLIGREARLVEELVKLKLECDEPAEPVTVRPKWAPPSAPPQRAQPQPPQPERRTVEDILDLTTRGPLEALAALQIVKAEIARDLWQKETN